MAMANPKSHCAGMYMVGYQRKGGGGGISTVLILIRSYTGALESMPLPEKTTAKQLHH